MNPGTFYLYEHEHAKRIRNVGFIRVSRHYRSCILQIHACGLPAANGTIMELSAFYRDGGQLIGTRIAELTCIGRNISSRLPVSESKFPEERPLEQIDGFLICLPGNHSPLCWIASDNLSDADPALLRPPAHVSSPPASTEKESPSAAGETPENPDAADTAETREPSADHAACSASGISETPCTVRRLSYQEFNLLPPRCWPLANNSFLLHGCHNYGHILLIKEDGRLWLGVPGNYDPREAKAADLYGFPRFTRDYAQAAFPSDGEHCTGEDFGHWCRCVGPCGISGD